jgi:hypothetical protein
VASSSRQPQVANRRVAGQQADSERGTAVLRRVRRRRAGGHRRPADPVYQPAAAGGPRRARPGGAADGGTGRGHGRPGRRRIGGPGVPDARRKARPAGLHPARHRGSGHDRAGGRRPATGPRPAGGGAGALHRTRRVRPGGGRRPDRAGPDPALQGEAQRAAAVCHACRTACRDRGERHWQAFVLVSSALAARALGDHAAATEHLRESMRLRRSLDDTLGLAGSVERRAGPTRRSPPSS